MLRVKDEEISRSGSRGRGLSRKWSGHHTEEEEEEEDDAFSESELELYEQYKAAGYKDLVRLCVRAAVRTGTYGGVMHLVAAVAQRG